MELRKKTFAARYGIEFVAGQLGEGKDGTVLMTHQGNAVKFLNAPADYNRELRAYRALRDADADRVGICQVPKLIRQDDELLAIEMTVVAPPFLLDFVSAYTDDELEWLGFEDEVWAEREGHWADIFGERWAQVVGIRDEFHQITGLHLLDLSLNNIRLA